MEELTAKIHDKYTDLKKRKLLDAEMERKRELESKQMCQALKEMEIEIQKTTSENDRLRTEQIDSAQKLAETRKQLLDMEQQLAETRTLLADKEDQFAEIQTLLVDEAGKTKELQRLLAEKNAPETIAEVVRHTGTPISTEKIIPVSNRTNQVHHSENVNVHRCSFQDEARELDCCRRHVRTSGNGIEESSTACVYHMLAESLVGMKVSLKNEMEGFSLSFCHEASGYSFTLTWLEQPDGGEWSYKYSSLGTLERIATKWMKQQEIRFTMTMYPVFFQQISRVLRQG